MTAADRLIRATAGTTVVALASIAAAISYSHMRTLAEEHGETGWRAHAFPLSVDGIEIVASLVLLADRRAGRRSGWLPWTALVAGATASVAANVAVSGSDTIGRVVAGWPAFALLVAIKLLSGLLEHRPRSAAFPDGPPIDGANHADVNSQPSATPVHKPGPASGPHEPVVRSVSSTTVLASVRAPVPAAQREPADPPGSALASPARSATNRTASPEQPVGGPRVRPGRDAGATDVTDLLPAARSAYAVLAAQGRTLTRAALAERLRSDGHTMSNARASVLTKILRAEGTTDVASM